MQDIVAAAAQLKAASGLTGWRAADDKVFPALYNQCKSFKDLFTTTTDEGNFDYGGWFNYFWKEIGQVAAEDLGMHLPLGQIVATIFGFKTESNQAVLPGAFPRAARPEFTEMLRRTPAQEPKQALQYLFSHGFVEGESASPDEKFMPGIALAANLVADPPSHSNITARIGYRGEGRRPYLVIQHQGAMCRADLDFWRRNTKIESAWHPWSGTDTGKAMYFRRGSKDNDYLTVTSVAYDLHIACAYPMFKANEKSASLDGPVSNWNITKRLAATSKGLYIVKAKNRKTQATEEVLADISYVYLVDIAGQDMIKTWELDDYPEAGVRSVPLERLLAFIRVLRIHHPPPPHLKYYDSTQTSPCMTIHPFGWKWWPSMQTARARLNCTPTGTGHLGGQLNSLLNQPFDISHSKKHGSYTYEKPEDKVLKLSFPSLYG